MNTRSEEEGSGGAGLSKGTYEALLSVGCCSASPPGLRPGTGAGAAVAVLLDMVAVAVGFCAVSGCWTGGGWLKSAAAETCNQIELSDCLIHLLIQ